MKRQQAGMRGMRTAVLAMCALTVSAIPAIAQDNGAAPPPAGQGQWGGGHRDPAQMEQRQLDMMTKHLKLTPDQVSQVKAIDDAQMQQMMALRQDSSLSRDDRRSKMMAIHEDSQNKIRAVLTDDQKAKFDAMIAKRHERMENRMGGQGQEPPPPPPPASL